MLLGDAIADRFVVEAESGKGGTGTVYRAWDRVTNAPVAVKLLHAHGASDLRRFEREASLLATLAHPNVVKYVAHGVTSDGTPYLAMEWLEGVTLADRLGGPAFSLLDTLTLGVLVSEALAMAHGLGVVHRDVKPGNLFLPDGELARVKILDFGVARFANPLGPELQRLTMTGALVGTPRYMSPEQARGSRDVDARSDVFSLGCVLFECVTGHPVFEGEDIMGVLARILLEEAPHASDFSEEVPEDLDDLLARMLSREPLLRPPDAGAVAAELRDLWRAAASGSISQLRVAPTLRMPMPQMLTGGERRVISVLLARDAGSGADRDATAETVRPGQPTLESTLELAVKPFGGKLEQLADGSITVILSGAFTAIDQASMAARCALALRQELPSAPIAIATGRGVIAGSRVPVGEVIDRAVAALRGVTAGEPGKISPVRLDEVTAGLLDARFDLRGDAHGLTLWGEREVEQTRTLLGKPTRCVGRDRELDMLEAIFGEAVSEPVARVVLVTATPGTGKSRLRYEFIRRVRQMSSTCEVLFGRGESMGAGAPFGMLAPAVRRLAGVVDGEPAEVSQRRLRARVGRHLPREDVQRVSELLGEMVGVRFPDAGSEQLRAARRDAALMGDAMRAAWEDWLAAETNGQPLLLVLEDLHWGDLPSVKFVDAALRHLSDRPFMVLALARPDIHAQFPELWAGRNVQEIRLGPLTRKAAERLCRDVLGAQVSDADVERVVALADGNAFYLEELIRAASSSPSAALPDTILGMVQARLDALGDEAKRVLRAASVFGERFWRGGVLSLLGARSSGARELLDDLCAREVITRRATATLPGEVEYVFRHALVRESAYAMLTESDRALGHRLAGQWLERVAVSTDTVVAASIEARHTAVDAIALAEHFDLGREPARAIVWYRRGAEQALEGNDLAVAIARAERGVACGAVDEALGALRFLQAEAHNWRGEHDLALKRGEEALKRLTPGSISWFRAAASVIEAASRLGDTARARAFAREASNVGPAAGADGEQLITLCAAAMKLTFAGRFHYANELFQQIDQLAREPKRLSRSVAGRVHELAALRAYYSGDPSGNLTGLEGALAAYEDAGDVRKCCQVRGWLGFAHIELGDYARAEELLRDALPVAERLGLQGVAANVRENLALALARQGRLADARKMAVAAAEAYAASQIRRNEGSTHIYLSIIAYLEGDFPAAERLARRAVEILSVAPPSRAGALAQLARALLAQGRADDALAQAREAMELLGSLGSADEGETLIRLVYAEALHATGNHSAARAAILAARDRLHERAEKIGDAKWRDSFLHRVPENARTLELGRVWGVAR